MPESRSYGQFCGLARALDHVGDRWTLLVVRELLLGPRTVRQLQSSLAGISPALLADRLRTLAADGLVRRNDAPARSKAVAYRLTALGAALEPAIRELIRWGAHWMLSGPGDDHVDPGWAVLALRALLDGTPAHPADRGVVVCSVGDRVVLVRVRDGVRTVASGGAAGVDGAAGADAAAAVGLADLLAVASGRARLSEVASVRGDVALADRALAPPDSA